MTEVRELIVRRPAGPTAQGFVAAGKVGQVIENALVTARREFANDPNQCVGVWVGAIFPGQDPVCVRWAVCCGESVEAIGNGLALEGLLPGEFYVMKEDGEWQVPRSDQ